MHQKVRFVGISGPQGSGKGSMMDAFQSMDTEFRCLFDDFKVSRHVQKKMGFSSLQEATDTFEKMIAFQNAVLDEKSNSLEFLRNAVVDYVITERTFIDIGTYFELWCNKMVDAGELSESDSHSLSENFLAKCFKFQHHFFDTTIIVPMMDHIQFEDDPNRAKQNDVDLFYELFMKNCTSCGGKFFNISAESINDRAIELRNFLGASYV